MSHVLQVKVLDDRLKSDDFVTPSYSSLGSAGIDLSVLLDTDETILKAGETRLFHTGMAFFLEDPSVVGLVFPRSGLGAKYGIVLGNLTGVIDSDYQGELLISLWNRSDKDYLITNGERVAQYVVVPVIQPQIMVVDNFKEDTHRGTGGFGSSGK